MSVKMPYQKYALSCPVLCCCHVYKNASPEIHLVLSREPIYKLKEVMHRIPQDQPITAQKSQSAPVPRQALEESLGIDSK
jgi:hypothetical protein